MLYRTNVVVNRAAQAIVAHAVAEGRAWVALDTDGRPAYLGVAVFDPSPPHPASGVVWDGTWSRDDQPLAVWHRLDAEEWEAARSSLTADDLLELWYTEEEAWASLAAMVSHNSDRRF